MVSGRDYPLNQSHESCTHNRPQVAITSIPFNRRGLWVSPSTSTSSSLRSWCWCPLMATAKVLGKCDSSQWTPASFTEKDNFFWVDLIDWIGDYLGWLGTAVFFLFLSFDLGWWVGGRSHVSFLWPLFEVFAKQIESICLQVKTLCPFDVILYSPTHPFHPLSMAPGTSRWFRSEVGCSLSQLRGIALPWSSGSHGLREQHPHVSNIFCTWWFISVITSI